MLPPPQEVINGWINLLTPIAIALLTVVNIITARLGVSRGQRAEATAAEVKETLRETNQKATDAVVAAESTASQVKATLIKTGTIQVKKLNAINKLVNGGYGRSLRTAAEALERIAVMTRDSGDVERAIHARKLSVDHDQKQRLINDYNTEEGNE